MRPPLSIAIVALGASLLWAADPGAAVRTPPAPPSRPAPPSAFGNQIPSEPGATAEAIGRLADEPSYEGHRAVYDGANLVVGNAVRGGVSPQPGTGAPPARARQTTPPVGAGKLITPPAEKPPFFDNETIGFAAMGVLAGGFIGLGLAFMGMGPAGVLLGAALGAALLVGLFKWKGYKKKE
ncbi:MAG: hypothetical protein HY553_12380 [Elusimicrobia bacterium]|nr:hypothetical protein [Elusimicrobiota bacterium]